MRRLLGVLAVALIALPAQASAAERFGFVEFPRDEHGHLDGWDFWWGAAKVVAKPSAADRKRAKAKGKKLKRRSYVVGVAFDTLHGVGITGQEIFPQQGPYKGKGIMSPDGPKEWGHEGAWLGRILATASLNNPLAESPLRYRTLDLAHGGKDIGSWRRTTLDRHAYQLKLNYDDAWIHPTGEKIRAAVDLQAEMKSPPLLAGGTGRWWYGLPESLGYGSRSYQYNQGTKRLTGTLEIEQPDGTMLRETVDPKRSQMLMTREYDATPEDLYAGLALAQGTQLHPTYAQYYHSGMPWELIFMDLENGAQLMLAVLAFHETPQGTIAPIIGPEMPTYALLTTLRLPDGRSVAIPEERLDVQHLNYKTIIGRVPTFWVALTGVWRQSWDYRVSFDGGQVPGPDGKPVRVPAFDMGLEPMHGMTLPYINEEGDGPTQRIPYEASGSFDGCPAQGFGWSELIINWYGHEQADPWNNAGGKLPGIPKKCGAKPGPERAAQAGDPYLGEPPSAGNPNSGEACMAFNPGQPRCEMTATTDAGIAGVAGEPGGWTVTIERPGVAKPIVIKSLGGFQTYQCGTVLVGDRVVVEAREGAGVSVGNPGICLES